MNMQRRAVTRLAPFIGLAAAGLVNAGSAHAQTADETALAANLEAFRKAQMAKDAKVLEALTAEELSYSHSDGHIEDKATFVKNASQGTSKLASLDYKDPTIRVVGDVAIVRFHWLGESDTADGKHNSTNLGILMTWLKRGGQWKLLDRAATKL